MFCKGCARVQRWSEPFGPDSHGRRVSPSHLVRQASGRGHSRPRILYKETASFDLCRQPAAV